MVAVAWQIHHQPQCKTNLHLKSRSEVIVILSLQQTYRNFENLLPCSKQRPRVILYFKWNDVPCSALEFAPIPLMSKLAHTGVCAQYLMYWPLPKKQLHLLAINYQLIMWLNSVQCILSVTKCRKHLLSWYLSCNRHFDWCVGAGER